MSEPGRRGRRLVIAVAVIGALWAAVAVNSLAIGTPRPTSSTNVVPQAMSSITPTPTRTSSPTPTPAAGNLEAAVAELQQFVEQHQDLRFTDDVDVQILDDAAFERAWAGAGGPPDPELRDTYVALGLIDADTDLNDADATFADGVTGFYDYDSGDLAVRGAAVSPFVRGTLVHELTHAIQDQNYDFSDFRSDELADVLGGLLEGGAQWTTSAYYDSLSAAERQQYDDEETRVYGDGGAAAEPPDGLARLWAFPYVVGETFVEDLVESGYEIRLRSAYRRPPPTSEQLLHLAAYNRVESPKPVRRPRSQGELVRRGTLGEAGLYVVLAHELSEDVAEDAAAGWGGDGYVVYRSDDRLCARLSIVMDTAADGAELRRAFDDYARKRPGTTVSGARQVDVTMCAED